MNNPQLHIPSTGAAKAAEEAVTRIPAAKSVVTPPSAARGDDDIMSKQEKTA